MIIDCPTEYVWLYLHCAKDNACPTCIELDGWWFLQLTHDPPYIIPVHDHCHCWFNEFPLGGLWKVKREELVTQEIDTNKEHDEAVIQIAFRESDIKDFTEILAGFVEDQAAARREASDHLSKSEEYIAAAEYIENENEEITEELQAQIDELLQMAEEELTAADAKTAEADALDDTINLEKDKIQEQEALKETNIKIRDDCLETLRGLETCLSKPCLDDWIANYAGDKLIV